MNCAISPSEPLIDEEQEVARVADAPSYPSVSFGFVIKPDSAASVSPMPPTESPVMVQVVSHDPSVGRPYVHLALDP